MGGFIIFILKIVLEGLKKKIEIIHLFQFFRGLFLDWILGIVFYDFHTEKLKKIFIYIFIIRKNLPFITHHFFLGNAQTASKNNLFALLLHYITLCFF